ncbi:MAG: DUF2341 domain-containing protein [Candidatus Thorarchaeota archaeon]|nr:DUF2341 domain-containing protein [Candidatus Thorarchaeota archaeon]
MKRTGLVTVLFILLFMIPAIPTATPNLSSDPYTTESKDQSTLADDLTGLTGTGNSLPVTMTGYVTNTQDGPLTIDSATSDTASVILDTGWTGTDLQSSIDSLTVWMNDQAKNGDFDDYHNEKWLETSYPSEDVAVPDYWNLNKVTAGSDDSHPHHGNFQFLTASGNGYGGTMGWEYVADWTTSDTIDPSSEIYLRQYVLAPYRSIDSAEIKFYYRVVSTSTMGSQAHIIVRFAGYETKLSVFDSGDPTDTWIQATVTIPSSAFSSVTLPNSILIDVGLATDLQGTPGSDMTSHLYIDDVEVNMKVRPFPEQIGLKANGTLIDGSTEGSIFTYLPDDDNRDCYDDTSNGVDLDGYSDNGDLDVGIWGSWSESNTFEVGLQFPVDIPKGAAIVSAYIEVEVPENSSDIPAMKIRLADADNVSAFTSGTPHLEDRYTWVDTGVDWSPSVWTKNHRYRSPDIAPLLQKVVTRSGWSQDNYIAIMLDYLYSSGSYTYLSIKGSSSYDNTAGDDNLARIFVEYIVPKAEDQIITLQHKKDITIDHTKVSADMTDFPVLVDIYDSDLHTDVQADGDDIVFMVNGIPTDHEIEYFDQDYNSTHAHLVAWVRVPSLSSTTDTVLEMYYGNPDAPSLQNPTGVWESGYASVWHMNNDPSTDFIMDSTEYNHDGTSYNMESADSVSGEINGALDFDGVDERVRIGPMDCEDWTSITVAVWVNIDDAGEDRFISKESGSGSGPYAWSIGHNGHGLTVMFTSDGTSGTTTTIDTSSGLTIGTWHYVVFTWDSSLSSNQLKVYIDGVLQNQTSNAGDTIDDIDADVYLADNSYLGSSSGHRYFNGQLDEGRVLDVAKPVSWILTEYNNQKNPSSFLSVGSEETVQSTWTDDESAKLVFTTSSSEPVTMDVTLGLDVYGSGGSLDSNYNSGTTYSVTNASIVEWTANVLVSPPTGTQNLEVTVEFPQTEWRPTTVTNPVGVEKTYPTDWYYEGGVLTIRSSAVDTFGVWKINFVSMNYMLNVLVGPNGGPYSTTTTMDINDILAVKTTTPWVTGSSVNLVLTDPSGAEWYRSSLTTTSTPTHEVPSFKYRKTITIDHTKVSADLTNFPVLIDLLDSDLHDTSKVQADGDDILFVQNGKILDHDLELFDQTYDSSNAHLVAWVKANLSSSSDTVLTMYYGNPVVGPQEDPKAVWSNSYEAVWHLGENAVDEGTGTTHYDSTSGAYDGEQHGNARATGLAGYGQDFDGTDDVIYVNDTKGLNPSGSVTLSGWFKLDSIFSSSSTTSLLIMEKYYDDDNDMHIALAGQDYQSTSVPNGTLVFKVENSNAQKYIWTTTTFWNPGWYHYSIYMDASNPSNNKIYIDGVDRTSTGSSGTATWCNLTYSATWGIGGGEVDGGFPSGSGYFNGILDELRVSLGSRSTGWMTTEYNNQNDPSTFYSVGSESERTSPDLTFTKTIDSTAAAGVWTASVFYNDTGSGVDNKTGLYEREFIVKHDSSLALIAPGDAVGDGISLKVAGDMLYVEVELTDDVNSATISGATVRMSWSVSGTATNVTLEDYGTGRYGLALNTSDLGTNKRWTLTFYSSHPYYNDATTSFYLDLNHDTALTYRNVDTTPVGQDFTATLVFRDIYDDTPITGASITFANGTSVTVDSEANGMYNISLSTSGLSLGDHWYIFNATKSGAYLEDASVNVTFTLRAHYTTASVSGDLVTPYGWNTDVTVTIIDTDTGGTVAIGSVSSMTFSWSGGSHAEDPASSFDVTLPTNSWTVGAKTVTLSVVMSDSNYYAPSNYQFDITIRKHYTSASVQGDLVTPVGFDTTVTVVITDLDDDVELSHSAVSSLTFTSSYPSYSESSPSDLDVTLPTNSWSLGTETVTLAVVMSGNYENPSNYQFDIVIRKHYTSASVTGDLLTPHGFNTDVTIVITDLDTGSNLAASAVSSFGFVTTHYGSHNESSPSDLDYTLTTSSWSVGTESITLGIVMSGNYANPDDYVFSIEIRNHYTASSVSGELVSPFGEDTPLTVIITDLDTNTQVAASTVTQLQFVSSYGTETKSGPFTDLDVTLTTNSWSVGTVTVTLTVTLTGAYDNPANLQFDVTIRKHRTSINVIGDLVTPYGSNTDVTIVVTDLDTGSTLAASAVSSFEFRPTGYSNYNETNPSDLDATLSTNSWSVGTVSVTLAVAMKGDYYDPSTYDFDVQIRNHYTSATVTGSLTSPLGNTTDVTVVITDLDTNSVLGAGTVNSVSFASSYGTYAPSGPYSDLTFTLDTSSWDVGVESVTLSVTMTGNYDSPSNYDFDIEITGLSTNLYHEPNDLIFPNGDAFKIILRVDIDEAGPYYGDMIAGLVHANFTVHNTTYTYPFTLTEIATGRYNLTIAASYFPEGTYTITVEFNPTNVSLLSSQLVITFKYRAARSELSSPDRAVTTPYETDFTVTLNYTDVDRSAGITGATITADGVTIYNIVDKGNGQYQVTVNTTGLAKGEHLYNLTADKSGYAAQTLSFKVVIRIAYTSAIPTVGALDIPVGNDPVFYVEYRDIDHDLPITDESPFQITTTWIRPIIWEYISSEGRYKITFPTEVDDTLQQNLIVTFTFSKGENYQSGIFNISVTIRTHNTDLRLVTAVEPTSYNANITIQLFYGDLDDQQGIWSHYVSIRVENETHVVTYYALNDSARGSGYYIIRIPASQFNALGLQNFTIFYNWTGPIYSYQNKTIFVSANIVGEDSSYTLMESSEPTPYLENMSYTFFYSELYSGIGITNSSYGGGHVHVRVVFQGVSVDMTKVDIWEVDPSGSPGNYSIRFNTTIFGQVGVIYMEVHVEWDRGVSPFYTNRTDTITIRILSRDTLVSVVPPSATAYGENATFSFTYEDITGSSSSPIGDDSKLTITLSLADYTLTYSGDADKRFTVSFNTNQFGAPLGQKSFTLNVTWVGAPFYANRTGRIIYVTVTARQTLLDYQSPSPTQYRDNVTFTITWSDVAGSSTSSITNAVVTLYDGASAIPTTYYSVTDKLDGNYEIIFNTTYYSSPGTYSVTVNITSSHFYYLSVESTRSFEVRYRLTLLTSEPPARVPYGGTLEIILSFQDLYTLEALGNDTGDVTLEILTPGTWVYSVSWSSALSRYTLRIDTSAQSGLNIDTVYTIHLNFSYANKAPFYSSDDAYVNYEIRARNTAIEMQQSPVPTPYDEYCNFTILYRDTDFDAGIDGGSIYVYKGGSLLTQGTEFLVATSSGGVYIVSVLTSALDGIGTTQITVKGNWTGGSPYYGNTSSLVNIGVTHRPTNVKIVSLPGQTRFQENVTFVISFVDLTSDSGVSITKSMITLYNDGTPLTQSQFQLTQQGTSTNYEISIDSTILSSTLVSGKNMTILVNYPEAAPYYDDDSSSVGITIIRRDTFLSLSRPANTAYGENATLTFIYLDVTGGSSTAIGDDARLSIVTDLSETPAIVYDSGLKTFTISFDTSQFGNVGDTSFHLNVTWAGTPYYANQTQTLIQLTVVNRQTQADFQAPAPTPFGDVVTFTVTYLDVAGSSTVGIPDYTFVLYYGGSPISTSYYTTENDGQGKVTVHFNTSMFSAPGTYSLNASFTYTGTYHRDDAWAVRDLQLRYRTTILSSEPVGSVGYGTAMEIVLYFQDMLTLENIGSSTTLAILNDTGVAWNYTLSWRPSQQNYLLIVQTEGQPFNVGESYKLHLNMSYAYTDPYYRWDDLYVDFSIRNRTSLLDVTEAPLPTSYVEYSTFKMYYRDVDGGKGISSATITLSTSSGPISSSYYFYNEVSGIYTISLNTSVLLALGSYTVTVQASWPGGAPFHDDAARNVTVTVVERTTNVEIVSPPSSTKYLDNVTFTFAYTDTVTGKLISITASNIILYGNGTQLDQSDFIMNQVGSLFEISINSTILSTHLVSDYNLTIAVDWDAGTSPYYADDVTSLRLSTRGRTMMVEVGPIETTPVGDNMTITFTVADDSNNRHIDGTIIYFDCVEQHLIENASYWLTRVGGGDYIIKIDTSALGGIGDFHFDLAVNWNPSTMPYYANRSTIELIGSVDLIWGVLTSDLPTPSSVQISQDVYVIVYYRDYDHGQVGITGAGFTVKYLDTGTTPLNLAWDMLSPGVYNISFSTTDITTTGSKTLNITASTWPYTTSTVQPSFTIKVIDTALSALSTSIQVNWTATTRVTVEYEDLLHGNLTTGGVVSCEWGGNTLYFIESGTPGRYYIDIDTSLEDAGTRILSITASKTKFATSLTTVSLIVLTLPSSIVPIEPAGLVLSSYRGEGANVTIFLNDTYNAGPINDAYVSEVTGVFEGNGISYTFVYNGTPGYYEAQMPGSDTNKVDVGFYYFRITVKMRNYNPASYQFTIELQQTRTILAVDTSSGTSEEMTRFYSEVVRLTVRFSELANTSYLLRNASVVWYISDLSVGGNMTEDSLHPGFYYTDLDTTIPGYGIWAITFRAIPEDAQFSNAITTMTLTVKRIPTQVFGPDPLTEPWGWRGNLSFIYWDEVFDLPVNNATARFSWGPYTGVDAIFVGNGTYVVPVDTSVLLPGIKWSITISFSKVNYVESNGAVQLTLELIDTSMDVLVADQNKVEDSSRNLIVPMGDLVNITFYYRDIEMFVGGIPGATLTPESELRGDTFSGGHAITIVDLGNGYYSFLFDTTDASLYEYTNGTPVSGQSYRLIVGLRLDNRTTQEVTVRIRIVDVPTSYSATVSSPSISLTHDDQLVVTVFFNDTWHGTGVEADFIEAISNNEGVVGVTVTQGPETGQYIVTLTAHGMGTALVTINLGRQYYSNVTLTYAVQVGPNSSDLLIQQATTIGLPISLLIILLLGLYVKVWSVPKRVRQINGQIRALKKGRLPKPISDAKDRPTLLAELFNDTYLDLGITRDPSQLPEESVAVEIPEMGELLMQLTMLTHLSPEELDEFKADISKMKLSEQAAFVKEVIHQEAIRAARRDGKSVDEVLQELEQAAKKRLGDMESGDYISAPEEEAAGERIILRSEPETPTEPETVFRQPSAEPEVSMPVEPEVTPTLSDRLSPFELSELKKQLEARGVPPQEIDTIVEQAKDLPRELVDELVRSLTGDKD